jgi:hypothetical protein
MLSGVSSTWQNHLSGQDSKNELSENKKGGFIGHPFF